MIRGNLVIARSSHWCMLLSLCLALLLGACTTSTQTAVTFYVSVVDGSGGSHTIAAFDAHTGKERWRYASQTALGPMSLLQGAPGALYVGGADARLYAISTHDGSLLWSYQTTGAPFAFAGRNGVLFVGATAGGLDPDGAPPDAVFALDARDGSLRWRSHDTGFLMAAGPDTLYLQTPTHQLEALNTSDGSLRWQFAAEARVARVEQQNDLVAIFAHDDTYQGAGVLYVLDAARGALRWRYPATQTRPFLYLLGRGSTTIYVAEPSSISRQGADQVVALSATDGSLRWKRQVDAPWGGAEGRGIFYLGTTDGIVYALDTATGAPHWQAPSEDNAPRAVSGVQVDAGTVYVTRDRAGVSVLDAHDGSLRWHYHVDRHDDGFVIVVGIHEGVVGFSSVFQTESVLEVVRATDGVPVWKHAFEAGVYPLLTVLG